MKTAELLESVAKENGWEMTPIQGMTAAWFKRAEAEIALVEYSTRGGITFASHIGPENDKATRLDGKDKASQVLAVFRTEHRS